ncbi:MAG: hypothetical protein JJU13_17320 [Balneolaceae bacterium]|nr:hypothetical protein [Balneolaceae bacterium]
MKTLLKLRSLFALTIISLLVGCAGITEANLSETDQAFDQANESPVIHQELPGFFNGGDQEDIIDVRPRDRYEGRE